LIKTPKKQLSDSPYLLAAILLLIPLAGLFTFASFYQPFFNYLVVALGVSVAISLMAQMRLTRKFAELDLQKQEYIERSNLLEAESVKEWQLIDSLQKRIVDYSQLKDLTEKLCMVFSVQEVSQTLSAEVNRFLGQKDITVILYLFHSKTGDLGISSSQKGQMEVNLKAKRGDAFDRWVIRTMKPLLITDTKKDFRFDVEKIDDEDARLIRSLISVPMVIADRAIGILRVDSQRDNFFTNDDFRFLRTIGDVGAIAMENAQLYERIEDLAIHDGLTGLFLRRHLLECLSHEISRALRRKAELSFLMIDLDNFKQYNDNFGHTAGDILLRTVGMMLSDMFRMPGNLVCRYGGEEFSVLLPDCPKEKAVKLAEELRKRVEMQTIILRREKTSTTVSIGVATFPRDAQLKDELIQAADNALYKAKEKGRNRVCAA